MSELDPYTPVYEGGTMSQLEFYDAEFDVDETMPLFETEREVPSIEIPTNQGTIECNHFNTILVIYPESWIEYSHIQVKVEDDDGNQAVRLLFGANADVYNYMMELDFAVLQPPEQPIDFVKEQYYYYVRGEDPMSAILWSILDEEAS